MPSFASAITQLEAAVESCKTWNTKEVIVEVATSLMKDEGVTINLVETLGYKKDIRVACGVDYPKYWLTKEFCENTPKFRSETLSPFFARACQKAGFNCMVKGWEKDKSKVVFICKRGRFHKKPDRSSDAPAAISRVAHRVQTTQRPSQESGDERCPFRFNVYWDERKQRWYLPQQQAGCATHCGHLQKRPEHVAMLTKSLEEEDQDLAADCLKEHFRERSVGALMFRRTGITLEKHQLKHMKRLGKVKAYQAAALLSGTGTAGDLKTPADKLLHNLETNKEVSYVALYGEFDSGLLTIRQRRVVRGGRVTVEEMEEDGLRDAADSAADLVHRIRGNLEITGTGGLILLGVAWTDDVSSQRFQMFPEFFASDVTEGTNSEARPLILMCGKDSDNRTFTNTWAFMPSKALWAFKWFFGCAVPALHPAATLREVSVANTDQDDKLYDAFEDFCGEGRVFAGATHRLCAFHKLDRNLTNLSKFRVLSAALKDTTDKLEFQAIVSWFWTFTQYVETQEEVDCSLKLLSAYLLEDDSRHRGSLGATLKQELLEFVSSKFLPYQSKLFAHHFHLCLGMGIITSTVSEIENSSLKENAIAPCKHHTIDDSQERLEHIKTYRDRSKIKRNFAALDATPILESDKQRTVVGVTRYASDCMFEQYDKHDRYAVFRSALHRFWVRDKRMGPPSTSCRFPDKEGTLEKNRKKTRSAWIIPRFHRTRVVELIEQDELLLMICSCGHFQRTGLPCRHMYRVLIRLPVQTDAMVRWWKQYTLLYNLGQTPEIVEPLLALRKRSITMSGPPINMADVQALSVGSGEGGTVEWFREALSGVTLKGHNYWSTPHGEQLLRRTLGHGGPGYGYTEGMTLPPFGLVQDIAPSERMSQESVEDFPVDDDFPVDYDNDSDGSDDELIRQAMKTSNPYKEFHSLYSDITKCVSTLEDWKFLRSQLHQLHKDCLARAQARVPLSQQSQQSQQGTQNLQHISFPSNMSSRKRGNAREKRAHEPKGRKTR